MTLYQAFWFFSIYAVLGWCLEVCFCTVNTGKFVNRGFLNGPVCPIYGFGMLGVLLALTPVQDNLPALFLGGVVLTSAVELVGGWALKTLFHTTWWDYSDKKFNIGGYICLQFSLAWGLGVVIVMRMIHPVVAWAVDHMPHLAGTILAAPVLALFLCDLAVTVKAVAKLNRDLGRIDTIARALHEGSDVLAANLGDTALAVDEKVDATRAGAKERIAMTRAEAQARMDIARADMLDNKSRVARRLVRAFPAMKHVSHGAALEQVKTWLREKDLIRRQK